MSCVVVRLFVCSFVRLFVWWVGVAVWDLGFVVLGCGGFGVFLGEEEGWGVWGVLVFFW